MFIWKTSEIAASFGKYLIIPWSLGGRHARRMQGTWQTYVYRHILKAKDEERIKDVRGRWETLLKYMRHYMRIMFEIQLSGPLVVQWCSKDGWDGCCPTWDFNLMIWSTTQSADQKVNLKLLLDWKDGRFVLSGEGPKQWTRRKFLHLFI